MCRIPSFLIFSLTACGTVGLESWSPDVVDGASENQPDPEDPGDADEGSAENEDSSETEEPDPDLEEEEEAQDEPLECTYDRFPVAMHQATQDNSIPDQPLFIYQARNTDGLPFDELQILSYQSDPYYGPSSAGTYSLSGSNYADCALCVLVIADCNDSYSCEQVFFASEGTLTVQALSDHGGPFRAVLRDAVFEEVTIDSDYTSTPLPGGDTWCIDEVSIDVTTYLYD